MNLSTKPQVVIDTNIFISGIFWGGKPKEVIQTWRDQKITLLVSPYLVAEISEVMERFGASQKQKNSIITILTQNSLKIFPQEQTGICRDSKDNFILDLCIAGKANYLVTGDKDLLALKAYIETVILKPVEYLPLLHSLDL